MQLSVLHLFSSVLVCILALASSTAEELRMNQIQVMGTHNSYHIAPPPPLLQLIRLGSPSGADALDYTHRPIEEQLSQLNVRQLEFDIFADPKGGLFARPIGYLGIVQSGGDAGQDPNANGVLEKPGMKVLHSPGYDYRSTVPTLTAALRSVRDWSQKYPDHVPILLLLELKQTAVGPVEEKLVPFDAEQLDAVDAEIRSIFTDKELITPDSVRGHRETLREAVLLDGWPRLSESRGKVLFALDNGGELRDRYLDGHPSLRNRVMFVSVDMEHPAAAFLKLNDPVGQFDQIQEAVKRGFIVRTRADAETRESRTRNTARRDASLASGAQYISTDYPEPDARWSDYHFQLDDSKGYRVNPVSASK
jgi:hypothetical protein